MPKAIQDIVIECISKPQIDREAVRRWLDALGAEEFVIPEHVTDPALLIALAAKNCYRSFAPGINPNVTRVRSDYVEYFDNILKSGHGSVLEHSNFSYAIEGCTRVFTAEMNRHRAGWAISEVSMRYCRFDECIPYWLPLSIREGDSDPSLEIKKLQTRDIFWDAFTQQEDLYRKLLNIWAEELAPESKFKDKKAITSMMRRIIGLGVSTGGIWTGNVRGLRHVLTMRCDPAAEEEIQHVFTHIAEDMVKQEPMLFGDFSKDNGHWAPKYRKV